MMHARNLALALALAAMTPLPGHAADQALIDAAKKEGRVTWYTTLLLQQLGTPLAEAFEKKYGIKVEATRNDPGETALRLLNEHRADNMQADVFDGSFAPTTLIREGVLARFQPELAKSWPKELLDPNGYWTGHRLTVITPAINTNLVNAADAPRDWNDLLDPKWKGKMAWGINPGITSSMGFSGLVLKEWGQDRGMAYLRKLAGQNITGLKISARAVVDQVIAGEYPLALQILNDNVVISRNIGAPVAWLPMNPAFASVSIISVTAKARHPNAGRLLTEFVVSEEGQKIAADHDYIPVNPNVAPRDPSLRPDGVTFRALSFSPEEVETSMPGWKAVYDELFR